MRLDELRKRIAKESKISSYANLTVFAAGSYARHEASKYSDIDMFFICKDERPKVHEPHTAEIHLFGKVVEIVDAMSFPPLSNDCQYLTMKHSPEMLDNIGNSEDDYQNYFTIRMLLLLESKCLHGNSTYEGITREIINSYYKDYHDHEQSFQPVFLLNDICRFWKTLLMNYESRRRTTDVEPQKTKQKVKNFKLKFSRMTTCFATLASLCSYKVPVTEEQVFEQTCLTPRERLETIPSRVPAANKAIQNVLDKYAWFLEKTALPPDELLGHFSDKTKRTDMFKMANDYGDSMFELLKTLDVGEGNRGLLRHLVI